MDVTRVLIVEDIQAYRTAFASLLDFQTGIRVVFEASTLEEARLWLGRSDERIDIALVAGVLPDGHGQDLIADLLGVYPSARLIILRSNGGARQTAIALASGASAAYPASTTFDAIVDGVRQLAAGHLLIAHDERQSLLREAARYLAEEEMIRSGVSRLTPRERSLLPALAMGLTDKDMAAQWGVSTKTIATHMTSLLHKLNVDSRLKAVLLALRYGFISLD